MFLFQLTSNSRKSINNSLVLLCMNQIHRTCFKGLYKHQTVFYCHTRAWSRINIELNRVSEINLNDNNVNQRSQQYMNFCTKSLDLKNVEESDHYMQTLYPVPMTNLLSIYNIVNNEFHKSCISVTYTQINKAKCNTRMRCVIDVVWPCDMSFSYEAPNKKTAGNKAALTCLQWLHKNNKIKKNKPLLYSNKDMQYILQSQKSITVDLEAELKNEIKSLIYTFEDSVKPIITEQLSTNIGKNDTEEKKAEMELLSDFSKMRNDKLARKLQQRKHKIINLPIYNYREEILDTLKHSQVLLIKGDTGCGKSTQVPQFIMDAYTEQHKASECNVIVSQPRKVAAVSLAHRVASERDESIGDVVGYHVRFESQQPKMRGSILFCTTGILLRRLENNPSLEGVSHIILDEAHERSLQIDLLLKLFKELLSSNPSVKLIIMSATINEDLFQQYFSCKVINVPGNLYPVKMHFMDDIEIFKEELKRNDVKKLEIPFDNIVHLVQWIIKTKPPGSILCFLPGWQEIKHLHNLLKNTNIRNLLILPLHSKVPHHIQQKAFEPVPECITKIVLATDIAESSITIKEITYVIDTVIKKEKSTYENDFVPILDFNWISKSNVHQRKGRAGRVKPGESYHLITKKEYNSLDLFPKPEIFRIPLEDAIIISKRLSNEKVHDFFNSMIESPSSSSISRGVQNLKTLGILDNNENLTSLGKRASYFSLDARLSRALVLSCVFQCLRPILLLVSLPFGENPSVSLNEHVSEKSTIKMQRLMFHKSSDHIAALQHFRCWDCDENDSEDIYKPSYFNMVNKLHKLHASELVDSGMLGSATDINTLNMCSENNELIRAILFAATNHLIKRTAYGYKGGFFTRNANILLTENNKVIHLTNESVNYKRKEWPSEILTYIRKMKFARGYISSDTSMLTPLSVLLFSHNDVECRTEKGDSSTGKDKIYISISNIKNVEFCCDKETANLLLMLRNILWSVVNYVIEHEGVNDNEESVKLVKCYKTELVNFLSSMLYKSSQNIDHTSDQSLEFKQ